jgi:hypothetical protein
MRKLILPLFVLGLMFASAQAFSQRAIDIEGRYSVGKTYCSVEWSGNTLKCYWDNGTGYTILVYTDEYPNGNIIYTEYESDGETYTGTFTFKDTGCNSGTYERWDQKKFSVKKR